LLILYLAILIISGEDNLMLEFNSKLTLCLFVRSVHFSNSLNLLPAVVSKCSKFPVTYLNSTRCRHNI
jgi:hypothetical protein